MDVLRGAGGVELFQGMWRVRGLCGCGWRGIVGWRIGGDG